MRQQKSSNKPLLPPARTIPHNARALGEYVLAGKGAGKSRYLGRVKAWHDFIWGTPQVIFDPLGVGTIDNFLDKLCRFLQYVPKSQHRRFWERVRYIDMRGGTNGDAIVPFPLYYRLGSESLREISERFLQAILKMSPGLLQSQVQGYPPLHRIGVYSGMILFALGCQITEAENLLRFPEAWLSRMALAEARFPEIAPAVAFFTNEYLHMREADRARLTNPFLDKVFQFSLDPYLKAMFGATAPGIDWDEVERKGQTVLLDFRRVLDPEVRRFLLLWVFSYLYEWIKLRGRSDAPFAVLIDEFAALTQKVFTGINPLATELDEFINQYMRNHFIWLTVAHQSINQLDQQLQNTLLSLGTLFFGRCATLAEARLLADAAISKSNPYLVKHYRKVWGSAPTHRGGGHDIPSHFVLDLEPEFMPLPEQLELAAQRLHRLGVYKFLLRPALAEGLVSARVFPITIAHVDRDRETGAYLFPDQHILAPIRSLLAAKAGIPLASLLNELEARLGSAAIQPHGIGDNPQILPPGRREQPINRRQRMT